MHKFQITKLVLALVIVAAFVCIYFYPESEPTTIEDVKQSDNECWKKLSGFANMAAKSVDISATLEKILHDRIEYLHYRVEHSLVYREKMLQAYKRFKDRDQNAPISGRWLDILKTGSRGYLDLRNEIYTEAERFECLVNSSDSLFQEAKVNPKMRLKGVMFSLAAALTLYDNYILAIAVLQEDKEISRILNEPDSGFNHEENELLSITRSANDPLIRNRIRSAQAYYENQLNQIGEDNFSDDDDFLYLNLLIRKSACYTYIREFQTKTIFRENFVWFGRLGKGFLNDLGISSVDFVSKVFGNSVGSIQFGLGYLGKLYNNQAAIIDIKLKLKAGDILLEKTPFRLTDKFIPGHWGHVAIWIGTKQELQSLGLWNDPIWFDADNHPELFEYRKLIDKTGKDGPLVAEALRPGVQLNTLQHFMNVDDVAILRTKYPFSDEDMRGILYRSLQQIGKEYDFNFDVETLDKIVCSELAYQTYDSINWETEETVGRFTISPDHVANQVFKGSLELNTFYHDGNRVPKEKQISLMKELMKAN